MFIFWSTGREARTPDTWFWRPVLYQLSYSRKRSPRPKTGAPFIHLSIVAIAAIVSIESIASMRADS